MKSRRTYKPIDARVEVIRHRGPAITLICGVLGSLVLALAASQFIPLALAL